ncbi:hypothetical protein ACJJTC_002637 [Scirpophaga incertulas]
MNTSVKRNQQSGDDNKCTKRMKIECSYGVKCFRRNPIHFREYSHKHLELILDEYKMQGAYPIPTEYDAETKDTIKDQLDLIVRMKLYEPKNKSSSTDDLNSTKTADTTNSNVLPSQKKEINNAVPNEATSVFGSSSGEVKKKEDYRPIVPPTRKAESFLRVVRPQGKMAAKHAASAPYHVFYTTISDSRETHDQPYSITFLEILDSSLGELKCSLQINFMVEIGWLLAQYYFAGYSQKKLTILYGEEMDDLKTINKKKPHVDAHYVSMATPFGKHHTKMMILCYEDGSLRVVVSTANLYIDDWENRTQGLWFSPKCPELPVDSMPHDGESPTFFKKSLLRYLNHYHMPCLSYYVERVKRCDFSHINVFLVASVPGSHFDQDWGLTRIGSLLRQHCEIPTVENPKWPLIAQASSIGSYGKEPKLWLTGDFLNHFMKIKNPPTALSPPPQLKLIYPSLENVRQSHDGLLGGGCLPYAADAHAKQPWLNTYLYQWKATTSNRDKAMPHIKSYTRTSADSSLAAFYLLTSGNISKAAWGSINKGNCALRLMSYEAGVLLLPRFVCAPDFINIHRRPLLQAEVSPSSPRLNGTEQAESPSLSLSHLLRLRYLRTDRAYCRHKWVCSLCQCRDPKSDNTYSPVGSCTTEDDRENVPLRAGGRKLVPVSQTQARSTSVESDSNVLLALTSEIKLLRGDVSELKDHIKSLTDHLSQCNDRINECEAKIRSRDADIINLKSTVSILREQLNNKSQALLKNEVEIANVNEFPNESLQHIVKNIAFKIGFGLEEQDIDYVSRVGPRNHQSTKENSERLPRPITVRFIRRLKRDEFLKAARSRHPISSSDLKINGVDRNLYFNERLTQSNRQLFRSTKLRARELGFRFCWVKNGTILVRKQEGNPSMAIRTNEDLDRHLALPSPD